MGSMAAWQLAARGAKAQGEERMLSIKSGALVSALALALAMSGAHATEEIKGGGGAATMGLATPSAGAIAPPTSLIETVMLYGPSSAYWCEPVTV